MLASFCVGCRDAERSLKPVGFLKISRIAADYSSIGCLEKLELGKCEN